MICNISKRTDLFCINILFWIVNTSLMYATDNDLRVSKYTFYSNIHSADPNDYE